MRAYHWVIIWTIGALIFAAFGWYVAALTLFLFSAVLAMIDIVLDEIEHRWPHE